MHYVLGVMTVTLFIIILFFFLIFHISKNIWLLIVVLMFLDLTAYVQL